MLSYWEKESLLDYDFIVIGGGITGLSTALALKGKKPSATVALMERGLLPTGASTRNAGFACIGSAGEVLDDLLNMTENEVLQLVQLRINGLRRLRYKIGDATMDYRHGNSYELLRSNDLGVVEAVEYLNKVLLPVTSTPAFRLYDKRISTLSFSELKFCAAIENLHEGSIDTGKMMRALMQKTMTTGVSIYTSCDVQQIEESNHDVRIIVRDSMRGNLHFKTRQLALCTNAFAGKFLQEEILPGRGQVLITKPLNHLPFEGTFHFDKGYYYFRNVGKRVLVGGGRNQDFQGEQTTDFSTTEKMIEHLKGLLYNDILYTSKEKPEIAMQWSGIMAFGKSRFPVVKSVSERIVAGVRMGGMGVAIGSEVAELLAEMMTSR
jgi:gamma-glutamylputrescine oxidase